MNFTVLEHSLMQLLLLCFSCTAMEVTSSQQLEDDNLSFRVVPLVCVCIYIDSLSCF